MPYDLILVVTSFRRSCHYLSIVKELSSRFSIGLYVCPLEEPDVRKYEVQNTLFIDLLLSLGATEVVEDNVRCNVLILPQWHYTTDAINGIYQDIKSRETYWDIALAMGNFNYENLNKHKIDKILIVDPDFYNFRLSKRPEEKNLDIPIDSKIVVGTPYMKYPVFDEIYIDYLIASPTPFSFPKLEDKVKFLENVAMLISSIPEGDKIVYKPHNAIGTDSLINPKVYRLSNFFRSRFVSKLILSTVMFGASFINIRVFRRLALECKIVDKYNEMMGRVVPLSDVTKYHDLNLEVFFPHVRRGVITGRSNTIWHALHAKLPVYNCVSDKTEEITGALKRLSPTQKSSDKMHRHNMRYFDVASCAGQLRFDVRKFERVDDRTRASNVIDFLDEELQKYG